MKMNEAAKITVQNLLTVKSIVTIMLTVVFSYLAVVGRISGEQFLTIFSVVVAFYFGTQYQKGKEGTEKHQSKKTARVRINNQTQTHVEWLP